MLNIDKNAWENTEVREYGDYERVELGGHIGIIRNADIYTGASGNESLRVQVDLASEDKQAGYFQKQYDEDTRSDKKWSNASTKYLSTKAENLSMLKGFATAVENSNPNFKWNFDEKELVGKKVGVVYGLEEYEAQDGKIKTATKLTQFRSLDKVLEAKIPKVKTLNNGYVDYDEYMNKKATATAEEIFGSSIVETDNSMSFEL